MSNRDERSEWRSDVFYEAWRRGYGDGERAERYADRQGHYDRGYRPEDSVSAYGSHIRAQRERREEEQAEEEYYYNQQQQGGPEGPSESDYIEGQCETSGHEECGADEQGPRCYCGKVREFPEILLPGVVYSEPSK